MCFSHSPRTLQANKIYVFSVTNDILTIFQNGGLALDSAKDAAVKQMFEQHAAKPNNNSSSSKASTAATATTVDSGKCSNSNNADTKATGGTASTTATSTAANTATTAATGTCYYITLFIFMTHYCKVSRIWTLVHSTTTQFYLL